MLEVHHLNNSRSQRVLWLLEELGAPYEVIRYERDGQTMLAPASLKAIHPLGKSPVIREDGQVIAETGAIIEHILQHYGHGRLVPAQGSAAFESYRYWMHYAEGSLMPQILVRLYLGRVGEVAAPLAQRVDGQIAMHLDYVESRLGAGPFLTGEQFTAADIQMSFPLEVAAFQKRLTDRHAGLRDLLARLHQREAYGRALEKGGPYVYGQGD